MTLDWSHFTPLASACGGALIGAAAASLMLGLGRIAGISGILGVLLQRIRAVERAWRLAFVLGLAAAPFVFRLFADMPSPRIEAGWPSLIGAGLLVGFGSRLGSGCTSGHGVCGLSRFSLRSLLATLGFMLAGFVTVFVVRHLLG